MQAGAGDSDSATEPPMKRQRPSLRTPAGGLSATGFPVYRLGPERRMWRLVRDGHSPWWFGSSMEGRFDLPAPSGTCYIASDDLGAILECLGPGLLPGGFAPASLLAGRHLRELKVQRPLRLANTLASKAAGWVTADLSTITPYAIAHRWAQWFHANSFKGIRYAPRHSTSGRTFAVALFGRAGERKWNKGRRVALGQELRLRLYKRRGITLFDTPFADELHFADDPA